MHLNAATAISTPKVLLVPYSKWHVPRYHEWMQDEEIQQATASEPLTLEEEYAMQRSWREDADKLTFIICLPLRGAENGTVTGDDDNANDNDSDGDKKNAEKWKVKKANVTVTAEEDDSPARMIGDINLFLRTEYDDDEDEDEDEPGASEPRVKGEIELMIAEKKDQGCGFGKAALGAFLRYIFVHEGDILREFLAGASSGSGSTSERTSCGEGGQGGEGQLRFTALSVKIGQSNERSLRLFEKLGFRRVGEGPNYFGEWEMELRRGDLEDVLREEGLVSADGGYTEVRYERS